MIEPLELRIAPATLINATTVTYQDLDGDTVTVKLSKPLFSAGNVALALTFDTGSVDGDNSAPQQLRLLDAAQLGPLADGAGITITARRSATLGGDGFVNVGAITAFGADLGAVVVRGDLGRIVAGDFNAADFAVKSLSVQSLGRIGTTTQGIGGTLDSVLTGPTGTITVHGDIAGARIETFAVSPDPLSGKIMRIVIGGSILGADGPITGRIAASGAIGEIRIGGDIAGGLGDDSGAIFSTSTIGKITIGGSIVGGGSTPGSDGARSGRITAQGAITRPVIIGGDIVGGMGIQSGQLSAGASLGNVTVAGSILGAGQEAGLIESGGTMGAVKIGGSLIGGTFIKGGSIRSGGTLGMVEIAGSIIGKAMNTGVVAAVGHMAGVKVGGSILGGNDFSGRIFSDLSPFTESRIGLVRIGGDLTGGAGQYSASIESRETGDVTIGGSLRPGAGFASGALSSSFIGQSFGKITIGGYIIGSAAVGDEIRILAFSVVQLTVGGSLKDGAGVNVSDNLGAVKIRGDLHGSIFAEKIAAITIGGSFLSTAAAPGRIIADADLGPVAIKGSLIGEDGAEAVIAAKGSQTPTATADIAIKSITISGRVERAEILAGGNGLNADAQIGPVIVGGDWIASSIAAGVEAGVDENYGTSDDTKFSGGGVKDDPDTQLASKIASITIKGQARGTIGGTDAFGFVAQHIGAFTLGSFATGGTTSLTLTPGRSNDNLAAISPLYLIGVTGDLLVREV